MKQLSISGAITDTELAPGIWAVEFDLHEDDIGPLCLGLSLLSYELTDGILVACKRQTTRWILDKSLEISKVTKVGGYSITFCLGDFEALHCFLLRYHRDGFSSVDHIDLELEAWKPGLDCTLVIRTRRFAPPMSGDEAKRILGID